MAFSDDLDCVEPLLLRSAFAADPWFSDTPFTKAITDSFSFADDALSELLIAVTTTADGDGSNTSTSRSPSLSPNPNTPRAGQSITISLSGFGSDPETLSRRKRSALRPVSRRVGKRKSRVSKKSPTTFITADAANFRQMVQQITGVKLPSTGQLSSKALVLKPEPQRIAVSGQIHGCLPTLDTSAILLDHHHQQVVGHGGAGDATAVAAPAVGDVGGDSGALGGRKALDFDGLACFPTLESWKVM